MSSSSIPSANSGQISGAAKIAGPYFMASLLNWGLFGALTVQVYVYSLAFPSDSRKTKTAVYGVYLLEIIQSLMILAQMVHTASSFDNLDALNQIGTLWISVPLITGLVTSICQGFFAYRIGIIIQNKFFKVVAVTSILLMCVAQLIFSIIISAAMKTFGRFDKEQESSIFRSGNTGWLVSCSLGDVLIAIYMISLSSHLELNFDSTKRRFQKVVRLSLGTGSITATISIVTLVLMLLPGNLTYYQCSLATLGKMYSNSMMVLLNNRMIITWQEDTDGHFLAFWGHNSSGCKFSKPTEGSSYVEYTQRGQVQRRDKTGQWDSASGN